MAGWAADDSLEDTWWGVEVANVATIEDVGAANYTESGLLKAAAEKVYAREEGEDGFHGSGCHCAQVVTYRVVTGAAR